MLAAAACGLTVAEYAPLSIKSSVTGYGLAAKEQVQFMVTRLLALDEPLGALDALTRISMQRLLERVWRDQAFTAILVTHDVSEAVALADRVLVIEAGRIAHDVTVDIPRPRRRGSADLAALEGSILRHLLQSGDDPSEL